jgi:hypothetical protein
MDDGTLVQRVRRYFLPRRHTALLIAIVVALAVIGRPRS